MVAATVTGLLASSLPGDVGVNGTVRMCRFTNFLTYSSGNSIPNFSQSADTSWKSFGLSSYPLCKPHHPFRRETPDRMTGYRADTRK